MMMLQRMNNKIIMKILKIKPQLIQINLRKKPSKKIVHRTTLKMFPKIKIQKTKTRKMYRFKKMIRVLAMILTSKMSNLLMVKIKLIYRQPSNRVRKRKKNNLKLKFMRDNFLQNSNQNLI